MTRNRLERAESADQVCVYRDRNTLSGFNEQLRRARPRVYRELPLESDRSQPMRLSVSVRSGDLIERTWAASCERRPLCPSQPKRRLRPLFLRRAPGRRTFSAPCRRYPVDRRGMAAAPKDQCPVATAQSGVAFKLSAKGRRHFSATTRAAAAAIMALKRGLSRRRMKSGSTLM
jgi:hypothetical protein